MPAAQRLLIFVVLAAFLVIGIASHEYRTQNQHRQATAEDTTKHKQVTATGDSNDPIVRYTFWLVVFTAVLALATIALGAATVKLWQTTEGHAQHLEDAAKAATKSADAASMHANAAVRADLPIVRLRLVSVKETVSGRYIHNGPLPEQITITSHFRNYGRTPAFPTRIFEGSWIGNISNLPTTPLYFMKEFTPGAVIPAGSDDESFSTDTMMWIEKEGIQRMSGRNVFFGFLWIWNIEISSMKSTNGDSASNGIRCAATLGCLEGSWKKAPLLTVSHGERNSPIISARSALMARA